MTYEEALKYIHGISWTFCKPGLERIGALCRRLGNPEKDLRFVHVAGTNGKGSFCSMLAGILTAAGYRTGLYTSPFILEFNERMQIDGRNISNSSLAEITEYVKPIADSMEDKPTEFELITAIALEYFKREGAEIVVLEAGMGGRLDSTNIIPPPYLSVITGIAVDHAAFLGDTTEKIAHEKAGIIKTGTPVLFGGEDPDAEAVIQSRARELGVPYFKTDRSAVKVKRASLDGTLFDYKGYTDLSLSLLGSYQPLNAANVLEAVDILRTRGLDISDDAVRAGLAGARWPARFEIIRRDPLTIFDGAHNPEGIESAVRSISSYFPTEKVCAVSGVLSDKDYRFIAGELARVAAAAFTITPDSPRALDAEAYAKVLREVGVDATPCSSIGEALDAATAYAAKCGCPIVCLGSLYTYADVIKHIKK
ncbi:MAG: bifunctional folylpolyglutamate synthase/dihydrofolate synthase [Clostridia bacterium]|nr:bifunctional folylpolyglutamate synthase/dihydrofolate synthase [Clostridia bacterium]